MLRSQIGDGSEHVIISKASAETNNMRDDGVKYLQDVFIVPPKEIERFAAELAAVAASQIWNSGDAEDSSLGWQG